MASKTTKKKASLVPPGIRRSAKEAPRASDIIRALGAKRDAQLWRSAHAAPAVAGIGSSQPQRPTNVGAAAPPSFSSSLPVRVTEEAGRFIARLKREGVVRVRFPKVADDGGKVVAVGADQKETAIGVLRLSRARVQAEPSLAGLEHTGIFVDTLPGDARMLVFDVRVPMVAKSLHARHTLEQGGAERRLARFLELGRSTRRPT